MQMKRAQQGAFLVMMLLLLIVLLAFGSLALDVGRLMVLKTQLQNAADAAALAAAVELDHEDGATARAMFAARHSINDTSHFARISEILTEGSLPDAAFTFYCSIGSSMDVTPDDDDFADYCSSGVTDPDDTNKHLSNPSNIDAETQYVRVTLSASIADVNPDHFTTDLIFLPLLKLLGINAADDASVSATALAGRGFYACDYPPMALCDPFESLNTTFEESMPIGGHIQLKQQGANQWSSGNFGFLEPFTGGGGASDVSLYLADEGLTSCTPPIVTTKPGGMTNKGKSALNTRFDEYSNPNPFNKPTAYQNWPPAPAITEYPLDQTTFATDGDATTPNDDRFGIGDWDFESFRDSHFSAVQIASMPADWQGSPAGVRPSRWELYNWEISSGNIVTAPNPAHLYTGSYPPPVSTAERRLLYVAVISCNARGLTGGKSTTSIKGNDGFAKMFLTQKAGGPPNSTIYAEFIGWGSEDDGEYHVDVRLYE